ncbi:MAG: 2-phospho-L-lactate guanylyltransferase [Chromatiales bacterium]|nr:2-phospho-L-lactate guanylyltransferase [Chromatiales bacterium]
MNRIWAILPVKTTALAKTRLASLLSDDECAKLALAMMLDVIDSLKASHRIAQVAVVTADAEVAKFAREQGCLIMLETTNGLNENLMVVAQELQEKMIDGILIVPGDLPMLSPTTIDDLIKSHGTGISLCAAEKDGGTNALLCTPPAAIHFHYGKDSARLHLAEAKNNGVKCQQQFLSDFQTDIDEPDDLRWLVNQSLKAKAGVHTSQYLAGSGIAERLVNKSKARAVI